MQQINLYLPEFRPKLDLLSAKYMAIFLVMFVVGLMFYESILQKNLDQLQLVDVANQQEIKNLEAKIDRLKSLPKVGDKSKVEEALNIIQDGIRNREFAKNIIRSKNLGNDHGFSPALIALASQSMPDITLTEFALLMGGKAVELAGVAKNGAIVPEYMHKLQADKSFAGSDFGVLSMTKNTLPGQLKFRYSQPEEKKPKSEDLTPRNIVILNR